MSPVKSRWIVGKWGVGKTGEGEAGGACVGSGTCAGAVEGARVGEAESDVGGARGVADRTGRGEAPAAGAADAVGGRLTARAGPHAALSAASKVRTMNRTFMPMSRAAILA